MTEEHCGACKFWKAGGVNNGGDCRRNPPMIVNNMVSSDPLVTPDIDFATRFPITGQTDWCGGYEASAQTVAADTRTYRIDREARRLLHEAENTPRLVAGNGGQTVDRSRLTRFDEDLCRELPHMVADIRTAAIEMTEDEAVKALIRWAPFDNALAPQGGPA